MRHVKVGCTRWRWRGLPGKCGEALRRGSTGRYHGRVGKRRGSVGKRQRMGREATDTELAYTPVSQAYLSGTWTIAPTRWVWLVLWILPALKTRAQYKWNNHLTGGSARIREAVMPNWGFWGNLGFWGSVPLLPHLCALSVPYGGGGMWGIFGKPLKRAIRNTPGLHAVLTMCSTFSYVLLACAACCLLLSTGSYHVFQLAIRTICRGLF